MRATWFRAGKVGRRFLWLGLPALAVLAASLVGAGWAVRSRSGARSQDDRAAQAPAGQATPVLICLGVADFDGGVLSLYPSVPGRVAEVPVAENDVVRAGAVLLRIDDE